MEEAREVVHPLKFNEQWSVAQEVTSLPCDASEPPLD